ncbi:MAG TPA: glycosyltransferase [Alphaproteobacteria bacterium]|nr:glycosyltransferase [Alphaproteobacteria bacterium]
MDLLFALLPTAALLAIGALVLPRIDSRREGVRLAVVLVCLALIARYAFWRVTETLPPAELTFAAILQWSYMTIEAAVIYFTSHNLVVLTRTRDRKRDSTGNQPWLASLARQPLVDILIPTYNEDRSIVERTIVGALALDHPRLRIWVLDDGARPWLKTLCGERGVRYIARETHENAKAGNLNSGLVRIAAEREASDFVAVFDADFVPQPNFLKRTLALFRDERVGLVQTPQHFFNSGPMQFNFRADRTWPEEQRVQYDVLLPSRDAWGTAFCCGTSFVVRYAALQSIGGGIPTESVTEDYLTTLKLNAAGWKSIYLDERLSAGLAPAGIGEYISQRSRWCLGTMQIFRGAWGIFSRHRVTALERLHLLDHFGYWAVLVPFRLLRLFVPALYWVTGVFVMNADAVGYASYAFPALAAITVASAWWSGGRTVPVANDVNVLIMSFGVMKASLVGLLRPKGHPFRVTCKDTCRKNVVVHWSLLARFAAILLVTGGGAAAALSGYLVPAQSDAIGIALWMSAVDIVILAVAAMACIERPRARLDERFPIAERAIVQTSTRSFSVTTEDLSVSGARIRCATALKPGTSIILHVKDVGSIPALVLRRGHSSAALGLQPSPAHRDALLRKLHARDHHRINGPYPLLPVLRAAMARLVSLFRQRTEVSQSSEPAPLQISVPAPTQTASASPPELTRSSTVLPFQPRRGASRERGRSATIAKLPSLPRAGVRDLSDPA